MLIKPRIQNTQYNIEICLINKRSTVAGSNIKKKKKNFYSIVRLTNFSITVQVQSKYGKFWEHEKGCL